MEARQKASSTATRFSIHARPATTCASAGSRSRSSNARGSSPASTTEGRAGPTEKEGFEPSRQGFSPPNALAGRRLQPLGHFSQSRGGYRTNLAALSRAEPGYARRPRRGAGAAERGGLENR